MSKRPSRSMRAKRKRLLLLWCFGGALAGSSFGLLGILLAYAGFFDDPKVELPPVAEIVDPGPPPEQSTAWQKLAFSADAFAAIAPSSAPPETAAAPKVIEIASLLPEITLEDKPDFDRGSHGHGQSSS